MKHYAVRLNDGETWTNAENCDILIFDEEPTDEMIKHHGIENLLARIHEDRDENQRIRITTWKGTKRIAIEEAWDS